MRKKSEAKAARRGPKPGTKLKPADQCVTNGRRLGLYLYPADHARLEAEAERRAISLASLARELIAAGLS